MAFMWYGQDVRYSPTGYLSTIVDATFFTGEDARFTPYSRTPRPVPNMGFSLDVEYMSRVVCIVLWITGRVCRRVQNALDDVDPPLGHICTSPSRGAMFIF